MAGWGKTVEIYLDELRFYVETENFVIFQLIPAFINHELLGKDASVNVFIWPFTTGEVIITFQRNSHIAAHFIAVEFRFIGAYANPSAVVIGLHYEFFRERVEIDILRAFPYTYGRDYVFFPDALGHPLLGFYLIHHDGVFIPSVIELKPL